MPYPTRKLLNSLGFTAKMRAEVQQDCNHPAMSGGTRKYTKGRNCVKHNLLRKTWLLQGLQPRRESRLVAGGRVLVQRALLDRLVECRSRLAK